MTAAFFFKLAIFGKMGLRLAANPFYQKSLVLKKMRVSL
jgi:hypothetical protein